MSRRQYSQRLFILLEIYFKNYEVEQPQEISVMRAPVPATVSFTFQFFEP